MKIRDASNNLGFVRLTDWSTDAVGNRSNVDYSKIEDISMRWSPLQVAKVA